MDETRKAASVAQLKELNDAVLAEVADLKQSGAASVGEVSTRVIALENRLAAIEAMCTQMMAKMDEPDAPVDFTPVLAALESMDARHSKQIAQLMEMSLRPVNRTGEATLPDGGKILLQVSETRM